MRIPYLVLKILVNYSLRLYFVRFRKVNNQKEFFGRTIYVSNHASAFMDPLVIGGLNRPIIFFMTRSDVFNKFTWPLLWGLHMLPIYRARDGKDYQSKNIDVFNKCAKILRKKRNLLLFGEGFTDDVFIRRLKPVKKGAVKIGYLALEKLDWKKKVYIAAVGCNYSDPNRMRSDLLISTSEKICLNDYREEYEENRNLVITKVTRLVEELMQEQITHINDKNNANFHEQIMMITRKGMNPDNFDHKLSLINRWKYSKGLAKWINEEDLNNNEEFIKLKELTNNYFELLSTSNIQEKYIYWKLNNGKSTNEIINLILLFPFVIFGLFHCGIPYFIAKRFVEKTFKRKVFWGSVKLATGMVLIGFINIPFIFVFYYFIFPSWWLGIAYYLSIGLTGLAAYLWFKNLRHLKHKRNVMSANTSLLIEKRIELENRISKFVPTSFDN